MIYFRCEISEQIGWGHIKRCLAFAEALNNYTKTCFLIVDPTKYIKDSVKNIGSEIYNLPYGLSYNEEISYYPTGAKQIILDLGHQKNLNDPKKFISYLNELNKRFFNIIMLDGIDKEALNNKDTPKVMVNIQPYIGISKNLQPNAQHWLCGKEYIILDKIYKNSFKLRDKNKLSNILITFGGADPHENTLKVIKGIIGKIDANIKIIIGPSFSTNQTNNIKNLTCRYKSIELVIHPKTLLKYYAWADLCIGGSSTSRYEAAACGLPMVFTAIYKDHISHSKKFAEYGFAKYVGFADDLSALDWEYLILSTLKDKNAYAQMIKKLHLITKNSFGTDQLAKDLLSILEEENF